MDQRSPTAAAEALWRRQQMVDGQLRFRGLSDPRVLAAMAVVPREHFVPAELIDAAYEDGPLPIGYSQTISQPYTVAFMCEALRLRGDEQVLEIGTGSGYAAAVLSRLAAHVWTVERISPLADAARERLQRLGVRNVSVKTADGALGWPEHAPFDAIVVTAAAEELPRAYFDQLHDGGRLVIPIGPAPYGQTMYRYTRLGDELRAEALGEFSFVPLISSSLPSLVDEPIAGV